MSKLENKRTLLKADDISIVFGGLRAVDSFSVNIEEGELLGLIGPNGAGKTTVFNMLSGIYTPTSGAISFLSKDNVLKPITKTTPAKLNALGISRTFQNIRLFNKLSVEDNVKIALHISRNPNPIVALFRLKKFREDEENMTEKTQKLLELFKIDNKKKELASNLPYGEQRKLEICRALAGDPKLLLLDEPAAGMNPQETDDLMKLIAFIRKEWALTILLIEHDMHLVMGICERLIVLNYGRMLAEGKPETIQKDPQVIKAYLGSDAVADTNGDT
jgi:branched-chain amino acid transport system ATP-binding protein